MCMVKAAWVHPCMSPSLPLPFFSAPSPPPLLRTLWVQLYYPSYTPSPLQVLLEWCDGEPGQREWISLNSHEDVQGVYVEKFLRWAKRILPSEQHRAVAWPARVSEEWEGVVDLLAWPEIFFWYPKWEG